MVETYREYIDSSAARRALEEKGYAEIKYIDHRTDGTTRTGTEDFSAERYFKQVVSRTVYRPTGELDKGGHRRWEFFGRVMSRSGSDCCKIARMLLPNDEISIRKY